MRTTIAAVVAVAIMAEAGALAAAPGASAQTVYVQPYGGYEPYGYASHYDPYRPTYRRQFGYGPYASYDSEDQAAAAAIVAALRERARHGYYGSTQRTYTLRSGRTAYHVVPDPYFTGDPDQIDRCSGRYASYDPNSNAFQGHDGRYYYCRL